jgi:hypothetical protein
MGSRLFARHENYQWFQGLSFGRIELDHLGTRSAKTICSWAEELEKALMGSAKKL